MQLASGLILLLSLSASLFGSNTFAASNAAGTDALRSLPVQDAGRVKPFDTFARESLQLIYGSEDYRTAKGETRPAIEIVMTWILVPDYWNGQKFIQVTHKGLKDSLKLDEAEKYFSPRELVSNPRLALVMQELSSFRVTKQKLTPYFQAVGRLENQLGLFQSIQQGTAIRLVPPSTMVLKQAEERAVAENRPNEPERWIAMPDLTGDLKEKFAVVIRSLIKALPAADGKEVAKDLAIADDAIPALDVATENFKLAARAENPALYPSERTISIEVHERELHPFKITWLLYLLAALVLGIAWHLGSLRLYRLGWGAALVAFAMHSYGFGLRMYLMGRPPVSNMYESVVWVSWGAVVFSIIFEALYRRRFILLAGTVVGIICLIIADLAPSILDSSLQPLEPVLRSNMWLTIHVLTITLSYSAFFLAWCLGNIGLGILMVGGPASGERLPLFVQSVYRAIQVGVVLLASGIILGGIWADYSWGRFWGWDPKETWALIALLGYLATLHGRLVGWLKSVGMLVCAVVAFNLVIMAWYGVNYVLGAGLHSYGFGAGGVQYVAGFVILNLIYVTYAVYVHRGRGIQRRV